MTNRIHSAVVITPQMELQRNYNLALCVPIDTAPVRVVVRPVRDAVVYAAHQSKEFGLGGYAKAIRRSIVLVLLYALESHDHDCSRPR